MSRQSSPIFQDLLASIAKGDQAHEPTAKDLNVSAVLAEIRDEGPAKEPPKAPAATRPGVDDPPAQAHKPVLTETKTKPAASGSGLQMLAFGLIIILAMAGSLSFMWAQDRINQLTLQNQKLTEGMANLQPEQRQLIEETLSVQAKEILSLKSAMDELNAGNRSDQQYVKELLDLHLWMGQVQAFSQMEQAQAASTSQQTDQKAEIAKAEQVATGVEPAASTELKSVQKTGSWIIYLASAANKKEVSAIRARLAPDDHNLVVENQKRDGKQYYRVGSGGYSSRKEAQHQRDVLAEKYGFTDAWIAKK